ncbi:nitroreductase family deazaflavin-dependent oxidoreductase [Occultella glacieicola]|uniref:Nitroreductase family deazaflavin-dependent oxidoreductase n=1 Tax=Occultella glacieicola TaxID=2518684 RepID=A0ABY2DZP3_9MICO|nr:nitroreductase family deazaflavin-dependent oxidoreductase [Occultella glacieicola]TDE90027.1 nitroreductase family deazaflavin-dependent oxidoreductase [Occultella glacieicola]
MSIQNPAPPLPPRWFIRSAWAGHKLLYRVTRLGLTRPVDGRKAGILRLRTVGRRTGEPRAVMICYFLDHPDGADRPDLVTLAMNGWAPSHPAWWLNLRANPEVEVDTVDGIARVRGREATGAERDRLLARFDDHSGWGEVRRYVAARPHTPVVVLSPR